MKIYYDLIYSILNWNNKKTKRKTHFKHTFVHVLDVELKKI